MTALRVAAVLEAFPRRSERFLARELAALTGCGVEPVICSLGPGEAPALAEQPFAALRERLRLLPPPLSLRTAAAKFAGLARAPAAAAAFAELLRGLPDDPRRTLAVLPRLGSAWTLARAARAEGCALIWAMWAGRPAAVGLLAARIARLPLAVSGHAWDVFVNRAGLRAALRSARLVTACSAAAAERLRALGWRGSGEVHLVHHGVECPADPPPPPPRPDPRGRPLRVLGAGRLVPKKGFDHLVAAAARGDFELELAGDGPELARLRALAEAGGAAGRVRFLGMLDGPGLAAAFARCDAICAPSVVAPDGDRDGVPNVLLEATLAGLPAVATAAGGLADFAVDGQSALVVPQGDPPAIAAALARLAAEPDLGAKLVAGARGLVRRSFDLAGNAATLAGLLREAAGLRPVPPG